MDIKRVQCDVLVIGCGGAGIRAAIEANDRCCDVIMVSKKSHGYCGSTFYSLSLPWGFLTSGDGEKTQETFYNEILQVSRGSINKKLAEILARESNARFKDLCDYGVEFRVLSDNHEKPCFLSKPRGVQLLSHTSARDSLLGQLKKRNIKVLDDTYVFDIVVRDNECFGAIAADENGGIIFIASSTVIMAAGGAESLWEYSLTTPDLTGDGYAMAARHGARLVNMEFIQFITGTITPIRKSYFRPRSLSTLPNVYNSRGEEFIGKYLPKGVTIDECLLTRSCHGPFTCEDISMCFDIAIYTEGKIDYDGVVKGAEIEYTDRFYSDSSQKLWMDYLKSIGIDTRKTNMTIYPHCQGFNGGIVIDENCESDIKNLYACGECAGGPHGANRIGGSAILATQVFGKIAGENAAKRAHENRGVNILTAEVEVLLENNYYSEGHHDLNPKEVMNNIKSIMQECACIVREGCGLKSGIEKLEEMQKLYSPLIYKDNTVVHKDVFNAYNSLITARLILYSMLNREESRGSHYRLDFSCNNNDIYEGMSYVRMDSTDGIFIE